MAHPSIDDPCSTLTKNYFTKTSSLSSMKRSRIGKFIISITCLVFGVESAVLLDNIYLFGSIGLSGLGIYLLIRLNDALRSKLNEAIPFRVENLSRFPRLPYVQVAVLVYIFIGSIFSILPDSYQGFILVLVALAVTQTALTISKENIQSEFKILTVFQFQVFVFLSTFVYVNIEKFLLIDIIGPAGEYLAAIFLFFAWFFEFLHLYFRMFK